MFKENSQESYTSPLIATMRKLFCCHKGESSKGVEEAEEQTQPLQPSSQSVQNPHASTSLSIIDENEVIFDENLFDGNEGLNLAWRNLWKSYEDAKGFFLLFLSSNTLFLGLLYFLLKITTMLNLLRKL